MDWVKLQNNQGECSDTKNLKHNLSQLLLAIVTAMNCALNLYYNQSVSIKMIIESISKHIFKMLILP